MAWVRIDDHFDEHPKLAEVGPLGWAVWLAGLAYCNRNLTDGFIPANVAHSIANWTHTDAAGARWQVGVTSKSRGDDVQCELIAGWLVDAGLWSRTSKGYRVHDFAKYQPSKVKVLSEREDWKTRQSRHRSRRDAPVSHASPVPVPVPEEEKEDTGAAPTSGAPPPAIAPLIPAVRVRRRALPDAFVLTDGLAACARRNGCRDPAAAFRAFSDYHRAKGSVMADWPAAFRTWAGNHAKYGCACEGLAAAARRLGQPPPHVPSKPRSTGALEAIRRHEQELGMTDKVQA